MADINEEPCTTGTYIVFRKQAVENAGGADVISDRLLREFQDITIGEHDCFYASSFMMIENQTPVTIESLKNIFPGIDFRKENDTVESFGFYRAPWRHDRTPQIFITNGPV